MTDEEIAMNIKEKIRKCFDVNGNISFGKISKELLEDIVKFTSFLNEYSPKPQERIYCILNDITEVLFCPTTNKKLRYSPQTKKYSNSAKHASLNRVVKNPADHKARNKKYLEHVHDVYNTKRYNLLSVSECIEIFKKLTPYNNSRINSSIAKNNLYFVCSVYHYTDFMDDLSLNISERIYCMINDISEYPVDHNGLRLKYISIDNGYSKYSSKESSYEFHLEKAKEYISDRFILHDSIKLKDTGTTHRINVTCKKCQHNFSPFFINGLWKKIYCPGCEGVVGRSRMEDEMIDFIKGLGIDNVESNNRAVLNGFELDIYLPDQKIAIEMCGVLWHSFGTTYPNNVYREKIDKNKHLNKYMQCKKLGISLITVFENEWTQKQGIVKSIIANKLSKTRDVIFARKCVFKEVDSEQSLLFLEDNHIQGKCNHSKSYGLYYNDVLVSMMSFGKRKLGRGDTKYELVRFCNKLNTSVVGGASKILKHSEIDNFISYCDLRYSNGSLYHTLGMKLLRTSPPNYFYTLDKINLQHRMHFQKHKIAPEGDSRTEWQIMYDKGYRRIYDCGNLVFEYSNTK